ncbi:MAG: biotin transporter BioY [Candidatus Muiribacteriota bacterium]
MKLNKLLQSALMAGIIALGAFMSFPLTMGVPFTMQIFFIFISVFLLEPFYSFLSVFLYLFLGIAGIPVFSGGSPGIGMFFGPTGGFLAGFLIFPIFCSIFKTKNKLILTAAFILFYVTGICWMAYTLEISVYKAFNAVMIFIPLDMVKLTAAYYFSKKIKESISIFK